MIKISHRGNIDGPKYNFENTTVYVDAAINRGYLVEVDIWKVDNRLYMTHDENLYLSNEVSFNYLLRHSDNIIIHCKNIEALTYFSSTTHDFHCFWHHRDDYTLTSRGWIWCYPGKEVPVTEATTICVLPEEYSSNIANFSGICTDFVCDYND